MSTAFSGSAIGAARLFTFSLIVPSITFSSSNEETWIFCSSTEGCLIYVASNKAESISSYLSNTLRSEN